MIAVAVVGVLAGVVVALVSLPEARRALLPSGPTPITTGKALVGGPFSLLDQTGRRVTDKDFNGRHMVVMFGFTSCPDICPSGLQVLSAALDRLGDKAKRVAPIFVSLDPERDRPETLKDYLASFHPSLVGLTGTSEEIAAAAKAYRVYYKKVPVDGSPGSYTIDHSSFFYLMDDKGAFVTHMPHSTNPEKMAERIASVL